MRAKEKSLILCLRKQEIIDCLGEDNMEILSMHIFDHRDLKYRMVKTSTIAAQDKGFVKRYRPFEERDK